ncbi:MAG TPA: hypothetical protein DHG49_05455 [Clostridiales bacterium]|nr:MAG: hypothetical protein DBY28_04790 [Subdoligranulum sp.]HCW82162.1 hypothetical protein [Clostridiales bacterium]
MLFFRFRAFQTVKNRFFIGKNGAILPRFLACFETIANNYFDKIPEKIFLSRTKNLLILLNYTCNYYNFEYNIR